VTDNWWTKLNEMYEDSKKESYGGKMSQYSRVRMDTIFLIREDLEKYARQEGKIE
jgi:hypothetical protein